MADLVQKIEKLHFTKPPVATKTDLTKPYNQGLVAHYTFQEGGGDILHDRSGYNNHGTFVSDPAWAAGRTGYALDFDGVDDYVSTPFLVNPDEENLSAFLWVNLMTKDGSIQIILQQEGDSGRSWLYRDSDNLLSFFGGSWTTSSQAIFTNTGEWHHVGLTYNGSSLLLYVDGVQSGSSTVNGEPETSGMRIGAHKSPSASLEYWNGQIENVRIYNRALTTFEVAELYQDERR